MELWKFAQAHLEAGQRVAVIIIIENKGSSPGKKGFKMFIAEDGTMSGSIGGGTAEYKMVELAKKSLIDKKNISFIKRLVHDADAEEDKSGMICTGEQTQAFAFIDKSHLPMVNQIIECQEEGEKGILRLSVEGLKFFPGEEQKEKQLSTIESPTKWKYEEIIGTKETLYIFGGGHVSLQLSKLMKMLDFRVIVYDNRDALSTLEKNCYANKKEIIDYKKSADYISEGENSYVVIMTVAHKHDILVLKQMLKKNLKYLGMMGSKGKIGIIHDLLKEEGFTEEEINRVDMPIGVPIKSKTPIEISVSIAAKIVDVRNS